MRNLLVIAEERFSIPRKEELCSADFVDKQ